jgi:phosphoribosylanthranilate isomerase
MTNIPIPRVKICCISSIEEAELAVKYGASAVGLVSEMPSGPGPISEELIEEIAATIPPGVSTFLLTSKLDVDSIIEQQRKTKVNTIQLVDRLLYGTHTDLRTALPGISIVQVIHVRGEESVKEAVNISKNVNAILLDSGNQSLKIKELGGTGRVHNWDISKRIVEFVNVPVFLAGGLKPENVSDAVKKVKPFGVDVCSGVRTNGNLDEMKLKAFFENVQTQNND